MSRLSGAPIRVGVVVALLASMFSSAAQSQQLATKADDADAGSSYTLRKSTLWFNRYYPGVFTHGAAYADLDKDGRIDVVVASGTGQNERTPVKIMMNTGSGFVDATATRLSTSQPGLIHARKALVGDYNGDGWPDVFIVGHGYDQPPFPGEYPQLFLSNGDGTLRYDSSLESHLGFHHAAASGDIDRNGSVDILVVQQGAAFFLVNNGVGAFSKDTSRLPSDVLYKNFYTGEMADIDQDGYLDVLLGGHEFEGAPNTIYWGDASGAFSVSRKTVLPEMPGKAIVMDFAVEDIDGDGGRDLVVLRTGESPFYTGRAIQIVRQGAPRQFTDETGARMTMDTSQGWFDFLRVQDVNGDRKLDIFMDDANSQYNGQYAWSNNGQGVFTNYTGAVNPAPVLSVADASTTEGQAGSKTLSFTVQSSQPIIQPVSFDILTDNGTAAAGDDYVAQALAGQVIAAGQSSKAFDVTINGDGAVEARETFTVNLLNVSGAMVSDGQALGSIVNDDLSGLSISDASVTEGASGFVTARFVISLSSPMSTGVSFDISTSNGSATSGGDYVARAQVGRVLDAGRTRQAFEVQVNGDAVAEPDETFTVTVSNVSGATLADGVATGTIVTDDQATITSPVSLAASSNTLRSVLALVGSTATDADACRNLDQYIAQTETRVAARELAQKRGITLILKAEDLRRQLRCR
ncbi:MAG: hypothetical protein A3E01_19465 [Gammaproteobacteria bacterium RIFCSPHIGHO2_12_FULL_63_22]|nr:MAG: hypothetical protein A3E01_19465 [Gammaproteobacteria bacterium RIFCSPHIGHO2_12_FULL_63_22]